MAPAVVTVALLLALAVVGVALGEPDWITPLIALVIVAIAVMLGPRAGFLAGLIACAGFVSWGVGHDGYDLSDFVNHRVLLFLAVGVLTGYYAHGALGDYHLGQATERSRIRRAIHRGNLAHGLGLTACAEGVEDVATWEALVELGCDTVQGYAISRPMPAAEVPGWLERSLIPAPSA